MTLQLTVRIADDLVAFVDEQVSDGRAPSRASVISAALDAARRRQLAERDAAILAASDDAPDEDDLDELATFASRTPLNDLD